MFFLKKIGWVKYQWIYLSVTNCSKLQTASVKLGFGKIPWNSKSQHFKMASHSSHLEMFPSIQAPHFPMICGDELLMLWVLYRDLSLMILVVLYRIQFTMIDCWHFFTIIQDLVPHSQHVSFDSRPEPPNEYLRLTAYHDNTACSMLHFLLFYQWLESFFNWNSCRIPRSRWAISLSHWRVRRKISQTLKHPWLLMKGWINGQFHMCCFDFCQLIFWVKVHFPGKEGLFFWVFLEPLKLGTMRLILASKCWPLLRIQQHWSKNQDGCYPKSWMSRGSSFLIDSRMHCSDIDKTFDVNVPWLLLVEFWWTLESCYCYHLPRKVYQSVHVWPQKFTSAHNPPFVVPLKKRNGQKDAH